MSTANKFGLVSLMLMAVCIYGMVLGYEGINAAPIERHSFTPVVTIEGAVVPLEPILVQPRIEDRETRWSAYIGQEMGVPKDHVEYRVIGGRVDVYDRKAGIA